MEGINFENFRSSNKLIVSFGGVNHVPGLPIYEFKSILTDALLNKLFLIDRSRQWYYYGLNTIINNSNKIIDLLNEYINQYGKEYTMFYGNSMGGYAAIKFGALIGVDKVVAFSPQTFLSASLREKYNDTRWSYELKNVFKNFREEDLYLPNIMNNNKTIYDVHYCSNYRLDKVHAEELAAIKNVSLNCYNFGGHDLVKVLKDRGLLKNILIGDLI